MESIGIMSSNCSKFIGKRIAKRRKELKMTQEEFSKIIGVNAKYISAIETGVNVPRVETLVKIMNALDVEPNYIFMDKTKNGTYLRTNELYEKMGEFSIEERQAIMNIFDCIIMNFRKK